MSLNLLNTIFKNGKIFALTPLSLKIEPNFWTYKIYAVIVCTVLIIGEVDLIRKNNFFLEFIHVKIVIAYLAHLCLISLNFYSIIYLNFWKKQCWKDLVTNLELTQNLVKTENETLYKFVYISAHIIQFLLLISEFFIHAVILKRFVVIERLGILFVQAYLIFFYKSMLSYIAFMLLLRYRGLKSLLIYNLKNNTILSREICADFVKTLKNNIYILKQTIDIYNDMFGWPLFFSTAFTTLKLLDSAILNYFIFHNEVDIFESIWSGLTTSYHITWTVILCVVCDIVKREAENLLSAICEIQLEREKNIALNRIVHFMVNNPPSFTAANFFAIEKSTILHMIGTQATFLIIIIQFKQT